MRRHRSPILWIAVAALAVAAFVALRAPAETSPSLDRALLSQRSLAAERPHDPQVLNDLGNLLVLAGRPGEAEDAYRRALEVAPELASARYNLGLLLLQTERPRAALEEFRAVIKIEPNHAWAHYQIGVVHDLRGSERRAVKHYGRAFRLDPQLAFPEVNPHVIQNDHVTEAMLLAYRDLPLAGQVPKAYEEPNRIVSLMVPVTEDAPAAPAAAVEAEEGMRPRPAFVPGAAGEEDSAVPGETGDRVLTEEDLRGGQEINQIVVPGGVYQPPPRGGTRVEPTPRGVAPEGRQPGTRPGRPRGGQQPRFVPGIPSTGRLELELFPMGDDAPAPAAPAG